MTQRPFTDIPLSTWMQIGTVLVVLGISYATIVSSNQSLADDHSRFKTSTDAAISDHNIRLRTLENQFSRFDERMINLTISINDVKLSQRETNELLRKLQETGLTR